MSQHSSSIVSKLDHREARCAPSHWILIKLWSANLIVSISSGDNRAGWRRRRRSWLIDLMWSHMANAGCFRHARWGWYGKARSVVVQGTTTVSPFGSAHSEGVET